MLYIYTHTVLFSHKEEWNYDTCMKMNGTRDHQVKSNKPDWERQISHVVSFVCNLVLKIEWQEYKSGCVWGWVPVESRGKEERGQYGQSTLYTCMKIE
jgi:hypothetical protein